MRGSIRKRGKTYQFRTGYTVNGKRMSIEKGGFKTQKECEIAMNKAIAEIIETGSFTHNKNIIMDELFIDFISNEAPLNRKHSTIVKYKSIYKNHISKYFKDKYVYMIKPQDIQNFYLEALETLSIEYTRSMHNFLHVLFAYAVRMEYIKDNVMTKIQPPKQLNKIEEIKTFTMEEISWLLKRSETTEVKTALMLGIHLGLRAGETYALRWSDFDFKENTVKIDKQLQEINKSWCFDTLKTKASYRTIKFGDVLKNYLLDVKQQQELLKKTNKIPAINRVIDVRNTKHNILIVDDFVNVKTNGEMLKTYSHKSFARICKKERNMDFKFHNLRHTHATILLENGLNPRYIQERLGHSKLDFTLSLYTHITAKMSDKASNVTDTILNF